MATRFMFATGIENSYPTIAGADGRRIRIDSMAKADHYRRWREDLELVRGLGLEYLRYGAPYYRVHEGPGRYAWAFTDDTFAAMRTLGLTPIADLLHFGVPDWLGDFQNPDLPRHFAEYAGAFAARYPWVRYYTPVNEIYIAALFSARHGWWNERLTSDAAFVTALGNLCEANLRAMHAILAVQPDAVFVQSESTEYFHAERPSCLRAADELNERRFLALDLTYGHPLAASTYQYLLDHGFTRARHGWFLEQALLTRCVMGNDYYQTCEHLVHEDGTVSPLGETFGYHVITSQYVQRYHLPVMHTETNLHDAARAPAWLFKQWANLLRLRQDGATIVGFTWYSLIDQVDWDSALREDAGRVNPCGLYDLERRIRPVGEAYRRLVDDWRGVLPTRTYALSRLL